MQNKQTLEERIRYCEISISDLAERDLCGCTTQSVRNYIKLYDKREFNKVPKNVLDIFDAIVNNHCISIDNIKVYLEGVDYSKEFGEDNPYYLEDMVYIKSSNVGRVIRNLRYHCKGARDIKKKRDGSYRFIIDRTPVKIHFALFDSNKYKKDDYMEAEDIKDVENIFETTNNSLYLSNKKLLIAANDQFASVMMDFAKSRMHEVVYKGNKLAVIKTYDGKHVLCYLNNNKSPNDVYELNKDTYAHSIENGDESLIDKAKRIEKNL